jgi:HSP20 family protein
MIKMSHALSNLSLSLPLPSMKGASSRNLHGIAFSYNHNHKSNNNMKAMAAESRENLDHLQRARKNPQQSQHKKRVAPAAPIGNQEQKLHQLYMKKKIGH